MATLMETRVVETYAVMCPHCKKYEGARVEIERYEKGKVIKISITCDQAWDGRQDRT